MSDFSNILHSLSESISPEITKNAEALSLFCSTVGCAPGGFKQPPDIINSPYPKRIGVSCDKFSECSKEDYLRKIQCREKEDSEWVFDCFVDLFSEFKPSFATSVFRGLRFTDAKESSYFSPMVPEKKAEHVIFLKNYEKVQGEGRHTLNSLLADYMDRVKCNSLIFGSTSGDIADFSSASCKYISVVVTADIKDILIENDTYDIIENISKLTDIQNIKNILEDRRKWAYHYIKSVPAHNPFRKLVQDLVKEFYDMVDEGLSNEDIYLEVLQIIQGICIFEKYFNGSLISLLTREEDINSTYSCVGEFFILGIGNFASITDFCITNFPIIDISQRYFFRRILHDLKEDNSYKQGSLIVALQNDDEPKNIVDRLGSRVFNFDALAGVIQLADKIRPFSIHEGKQQNFTFIIAYPYLHQDRLDIISDLKTDPITWLIPTRMHKDTPPTSIMRQNEAIFKARARILGNSQTLQEKGVAIFVNCLLQEPTCDCVVKPHPRGLSRDRTDLVDILSDIDDAFIVKILGQKRIEIFHRGDKILVWSHVSASWEKENTWNLDKLKTFILNKLCVVDSNSIKILVDTIYKISQTQGEGGSFVIVNDEIVDKDICCPAMTKPFPKLGEGSITDSKKLLNVAVEDGGTLIELGNNKFLGRRQWLPHRKHCPPFWHETFEVPKIAWDQLLSESWDTEKPNEETILVSDAPQELYSLCTFKYFSKETNGNVLYHINPWYWEGYYKILSWGTRHLSSMGMSACLWNDAVVIVVSADNTITAFHQGVEKSN